MKRIKSIKPFGPPEQIVVRGLCVAAEIAGKLKRALEKSHARSARKASVDCRNFLTSLDAIPWTKADKQLTYCVELIDGIFKSRNPVKEAELLIINLGTLLFIVLGENER